jgi:hypothetical protein
MQAIIDQLRLLDELPAPANQLGLPNYYEFIAYELSCIINKLIQLRDTYVLENDLD